MKTKYNFVKGLISIFLLLFFMLTVSSFHMFNSLTASQDGQLVNAGEIKVTTANLNMRTGPGTSNKVILVIPKGAPVDILSYSGDWAKLTYNGKQGYAHTAYLKSQANVIKYTTANLNLRTGPGTTYSVILVIPKGAEVSILDGNSTWNKVIYGGKTGFVHSNYLTSSKSAPSSPTKREPAVVIHKGNKSSSIKRIALTFDDYGSADQVRSILKTLGNYNARGTFFPNGDFIKNNPTLIKEILSKGHSLGSHTYSHKDLTKQSDAEVRNQIRLAQNTIFNVTGKYPTLMRPPYGAYDNRTKNIAGQEGIKYLVMWSVDTSDWATTRYGVSITTDYVINTAVNNASQNEIILMHMHSNKTVSGLSTILKRLRDEGYQFVTVDDMVN